MPHALGIPDSPLPRVVVAGSGFGGIRLVKLLAGRGFQVVLVDRNNYHTFQPLLYQVATGGLEPDSIGYPVRNIFHGRKDFYFRMAVITGVDPENRLLITDSGAISYDFMVLALGTESNFFGMQQLSRYALPLKTMQDAMELRSHVLGNMERALRSAGPREPFLNMVIAGGGPTGVELAGALTELKKHVLPGDYPELDWSRVRIIVAEAGPVLLQGMSPASSQGALQALNKMGVEVKLNTAVCDFDGSRVTLADGDSIPAGCFIWSAGMKGVPVPGIRDSVRTPGNRIRVDRFNQVPHSGPLYVIGDLAYMEEENYPKGHPMVAQVAIQQATNLARTIHAIRKGREGKPFHYKNKGALATIGRGKAVADFPIVHLSGFTAWMLWLVIHLMTLVGFRNRLVVFVNWMWNYFSYDRAIRLIFTSSRKGNPPTIS
jgi:NADH dehydrogenase